MMKANNKIIDTNPIYFKIIHHANSEFSHGYLWEFKINIQK
ncbi:MAG: hypothetical protein ACTSRA_06890 [Promethearchaeota archaeon]